MKLNRKSRLGQVEYGRPLEVLDVKTAGDSWTVEGYTSTYNNEDHVGDVVLPGAFDRVLAGSQKTLFLYCHKLDQMLGVPIQLKSDAHGLFGRFRISRTPLGETVHTLMTDEAPFGFSIGFFPDEYEYADSGTRLLKQIDLVENTLAPLPIIANPLAQVTAFKTLLGLPEVETKAVWSQAYVNDLEDDCFAGVEPGGKKDDEGKTVPRDLRHLPHHAKGNGGDGPVDLVHLRNALARVEQMEDGGPEFRAKCRAHLERHARAEGIGDRGDSGKTVDLGEQVLSPFDFDPAEVPFDRAWQEITRLLTDGVEHTKSLHARRSADGREFGPRHTEALRGVLTALESAQTDVKHLLALPAPAEVVEAKAPAPATNELQELRARVRRKLAQHHSLMPMLEG